jgi:hypothetical protein
LHATEVRRSSAVKLTLLPMLASAAVAAQPAADDEPPLQPPGETAPMLSPPGLTPTMDDCREQPDDPRCPAVEEPEPEPGPEEEEPVAVFGGFVHGGFGGHAHGRLRPCVFRGGFGHYFWAAGG